MANFREDDENNNSTPTNIAPIQTDVSAGSGKDLGSRVRRIVLIVVVLVVLVCITIFVFYKLKKRRNSAYQQNITNNDGLDNITEKRDITNEA